jgi:hypothetical protein
MNNYFGSTQFETMNYGRYFVTPSFNPEPFLLNQSARSSTSDYRVAAIFPEHFQSFTVALNINLFTNYFALGAICTVEAETKTNSQKAWMGSLHRDIVAKAC